MNSARVRWLFRGVCEGAMDKATLAALDGEIDRLLSEFDSCFRSKCSREHLGVYVRGQLGPLQRKSVEPIALDAEVAPRSLQQFVGSHVWSEERMRRKVRRIVARDHADPDAIAIIDDTSYAKKGRETVGVQRQWCGTKGQVENCVQSVHITYATSAFSTIVDGDVFLPKSWIEDFARRERAGVPKEISFRTKPQIAIDLLDRTLADGLRPRWISADEAYGRSSDFLIALQKRALFYVVEVPCDTHGWTRRAKDHGGELRRADKLFPRGGPAWTTFNVKDTSKGPQVWHARATRFVLNSISQFAGEREHWLVIAENALTEEKKYFLSNAPENTDIKTLLAVAFSRWNVERNFEDAKQEVGLDHFEVRTYRAVQRHLAMSMVSLLFLARTSRTLKAEKKRRTGRSRRCGSC
jgi:SRSO17 transposase